MQATSKSSKGWKLVAVASALAFATSIGVTVARGADVPAAEADQPHMDAAKQHLRAARDFLEHAEHNKGGHREEAKRLTDDAIHEVEAGINFAE